MKWPHVTANCFILSFGGRLAECADQNVVLRPRNRKHRTVANGRRQMKFIPGRFLMSRYLEPGAIECSGYGKAIGNPWILFVVQIPRLAIRGGDKRGCFAKVWADGWSRLGIGSQQVCSAANPD